ncbi:MAG TPA: exodeoxyribonuclease III, partial [Bacteroidales bacterium]|nr:exodeoxyribonuclease III [Bacteroidales bacterium]
MTKIISYNVNGIRAAISKGFVDWLAHEQPEIIHIQETKALKEQVDIETIHALGYETYWFSAQKKGYSGVAILSRIPIDHIEYGTGIEQSDFEGRVIRADIGDIS